MRKCAILLWIALSTALASCADKPVMVAVDTLCTSTTRYHTSDDQRAAAKAAPDVWGGLFRWLAAFNQVRDQRCANENTP